MKVKRRINETALIESFSRAVKAAGIKPLGLVAGIGDDAAIFRGQKGKDLVITQDIQVEGRHFETRWLSG